MGGLGPNKKVTTSRALSPAPVTKVEAQEAAAERTDSDGCSSDTGCRSMINVYCCLGSSVGAFKCLFSSSIYITSFH